MKHFSRWWHNFWREILQNHIFWFDPVWDINKCLVARFLWRQNACFLINFNDEPKEILSLIRWNKAHSNVSSELDADIAAWQWCMEETPPVPWHIPSSSWKHESCLPLLPALWLMPHLTNYFSRGKRLAATIATGSKPDQTPACLCTSVLGIHNGKPSVQGCRRWHGLLHTPWRGGRTSQMGLGLEMKTRNKINGLGRESSQSIILLLWSSAAVGCGKPGWLCALIMAMPVCRAGNSTSRLDPTGRGEVLQHMHQWAPCRYNGPESC